MRVQSRDFIETREGLIFAVVADVLECGNILCFLRYVKSAKGYKKLSTEAANKLLADDYPDYLYHSDARDADLHAVTENSVVKHYLPRSAVSEIRTKLKPDKIETIDKASIEERKTAEADRRFLRRPIPSAGVRHRPESSAFETPYGFQRTG